MTRFRQIWNPGCYSSLTNPHRDWHKKQFQCPHGLELLLIMDGMPVQRIRFNALSGLSCYNWLHYNIFRYHCCFNALSGLSCYHDTCICSVVLCKFQCPLGLELLLRPHKRSNYHRRVSMPSRAWVVTAKQRFLSCWRLVSMPSRAWVVTARPQMLTKHSIGFNALSGLSCYITSLRKRV